MALKLTRNAAETLNDILLNALQQNGIGKTETLEKQLFDRFDNLRFLSESEQQEGVTLMNSTPTPYTLLYRILNADIVILAIVHSTRLPQSLKV